MNEGYVTRVCLEAFLNGGAFDTEQLVELLNTNYPRALAISIGISKVTLKEARNLADYMGLKMYELC